MAILDHNRLIKEFYEEVKEQFPNLSFDEVDTICKSPYQAIRKWIVDGTLPVINIKFLGKFKVFRGKIDKIMAHRKGKSLDAEKYNLNTDFLMRYREELSIDQSEEQDFTLTD